MVISQAGKAAETLFIRLQTFPDATLVEAAPKTGRTHQIRVHAASLGHPLIGDDRYGIDEVNKTFKNKGCKRMFLHAETLQFVHPVTEVKMSVSAPLPSDLTRLLKNAETL